MQQCWAAPLMAVNPPVAKAGCNDKRWRCTPCPWAPRHFVSPRVQWRAGPAPLEKEAQASFIHISKSQGKTCLGVPLTQAYEMIQAASPTWISINSSVSEEQFFPRHRHSHLSQGTKLHKNLKKAEHIQHKLIQNRAKLHSQTKKAVLTEFLLQYKNDGGN